MKWIPTNTTSASTATANAALSTLLTEAESLYAQAQKYREMMEQLAEADPQRKVYEQIILDLLMRAQSMSLTVKSSSGQ